MKLREDAIVIGIPYKWKTNLADNEIADFYRLHKDNIGEKACEERSTGIRISIRFGFLPFQDGFCVWTANGDTHTVIFRTVRDWELWDARQNEIEELRQEQAEEEYIEQQLLMIEDAHLEKEAELALNAKNYDAAAAYTTTRAELRASFKKYRLMPPGWEHWYPDLIFARFPTSQHGIEFFRTFFPLAQTFANFAHWYSVRCGLTGDALVEQTKAIYFVGMKMFPDNGNLAQAACLFFRRVGSFEMAINVCRDAIKRGLRDQTKSGFEGRLVRLQREFQHAAFSNYEPQ
ncbi:MAG TPA: hypothetical protein VHY22_06305 [Chthoniobacteraceae bacterium]|jgi:hypothetical protein|nr:hypothetical protein [Chthoniobacteraceae bacterium]